MFAEVFESVKEMMNDAGIPTYTRTADVYDLPAAIIAPAHFHYDRLSAKAYTMTAEVFLIARDPGQDLAALEELGGLAEKLKSIFPVQDFEAAAVTVTNLGGGDSLPALTTTISVSVEEE